MHLIRSSSAAPLILLLSACATAPDTVVFVTKTSMGIDVEQQTPGVSIAYDRVEGYLAPRYEGAQIPPVFASFNSNGEIYNRDVRHVYATGKAARAIAANQALLARMDTTNKLHNLASFPYTPEPPPDVKAAPTAQAKKSMFFGTSTTIGLKIATTDLTGDTFTFGVKRKEMSVIPGNGAVEDFPSVIAFFSSDLDTSNLDVRNVRKAKNILDIRQFFATGSAADEISNDGIINYQFYLTTKRAIPEAKEGDPKPEFADPAVPTKTTTAFRD